MLNKLLKYDLKYMLKNMSIFYILAIFFALLFRFLSLFNQTVIVSILSNITTGCLISMLVNILINTMLRSWVRFRDSIYKDEAYLTHTLPVTKSDIYNSKFLQTLIFFIVSFIIMLVSLFIAYYTKDTWIIIKNFLNGITTGLNMSISGLVFAFIAIIFLEVFNAIQCGFLGIILGHQMSNAKIAFSALFGFMAYLLSQTIVLLMVFAVGIFNSGIMELFNSEVIYDISSLKLLFVLSSSFYVVVIILMSFLCKFLLKKGVNIE